MLTSVKIALECFIWLIGGIGIGILAQYIEDKYITGRKWPWHER
jgi:hypothetical protein